ncbi:unnamed protein product [Calicophoron daubneyi]|uniref:Mitochondrial carrier protein n=1 Tax=Calicophoron daubneyi TaxID=300641 RepID=A0AAV2TWX2_CALDB
MVNSLQHKPVKWLEKKLNSVKEKVVKNTVEDSFELINTIINMDIDSVFYATTYETIRHGASAFPSLTSAERSFIGGAFASVVAQTLVVPVDIVSQHLMVLSRPYKTTQQSLSQTYHHPARPVTFSSVVPNGRMDGVRALTPIRLTPEELSTSWSRFKAVTRHIASTHGILGFYHGYLISLGTFVPSSALWWAFYDKYCRWIACLSSKFSSRNPFHSIRTQGHHSAEGAGHSGFELPRLSIQLLAAPLAGVSAATLCNPVDCVRVRMQVGNIPFVESVRTLWVTEGIRWFVKGLSARLIQTGVCSFWLILIYEPVKLFCLKDEFRDRFGLQSPENSK